MVQPDGFFLAIDAVADRVPDQEQRAEHGTFRHHTRSGRIRAGIFDPRAFAQDHTKNESSGGSIRQQDMAGRKWGVDSVSQRRG